MKALTSGVLLLLSPALVLLVVRNTDPVQARTLWLSAEIPVVVLLFLTAAGGLVAGLLVTLLIRGAAKS